MMEIPSEHYGLDYQYCIAVYSLDKDTIRYVKNAMSKSIDKGLASLNERFLTGNILSIYGGKEYLVHAADVKNATVYATSNNFVAGAIKDYEDKWNIG